MYRGGATALHTGKSVLFFYFCYLCLCNLALSTSHKLAGVLALSTWIPLSSTFPKVRFYQIKSLTFICFKALVSRDKKVNLPILQCHGISKTHTHNRIESFCFVSFKEIKIQSFN